MTMPLQAQQCLGVLPGNAAAAAELKAIQAVLRLRELSVEMLPMQFQQVLFEHATMPLKMVITPCDLSYGC